MKLIRLLLLGLILCVVPVRQSWATYAVLSSVNSSSATLGAGATFNGSYEDVSQYSQVMITVQTDRPSGNNGLSFIWSNDGVNQGKVDGFSFSNAALGAFTAQACYVLPVRGNYLKVQYVNNGANAQAVFVMQTWYCDARNDRVLNVVSAGMCEWNGQLYAIQWALFERTAAGTTVIKAGSPNSVIVVLNVEFQSSATTALPVIQDSGGALNIVGPITVVANGIYQSHRTLPDYVGKCGSGNSLQITTSGAGIVRGNVTYIVVNTDRHLGQ